MEPTGGAQSALFRQFLIPCIAVLIGCISIGSVAAQDISIQADLVHDDNELPWKLTYRLSRSVQALAFQRVSVFRSGQWEVISPNISLKTLSGRETLVGNGGRSFRTVVIRLQQDFGDLPADYAFFQGFSDGGVIVYSGHLNVEPVALVRGKGYSEDTIERPPGRLTETFGFAPAISERVIVNGEQHKGPVTGLTLPGDGTYVYFGSATPVESRATIAVFDPTLPSWLKREAQTLLPRLFEFYAQKTGLVLANRPVVFLGFDARPKGLSYSGGALPGLIQLTVSGRDWDNEKPEVRELFAEFLAHEAAHLWNGQMFLNLDQRSGASWMHEGGADAFAYRALLALGVIDNKRFNERLSWALNRCAAGVVGSTVRVRSNDAQANNFYVCGSTMALITEAATRRARSRNTIFEFWRQLFESAQANRGRYTEAMYFETLGRISGDELTRNTIRDFVTKQQTSPLDVIVGRLRALGVSTSTIDSDIPQEHKRFLSFDALSKLAAHDCGGRSSVRYRAKNLQVAGGSQCRGLRQSSYRIQAIGGHDVYQQGPQAYDYVESQCQRNQTVTLQTREGETVAVRCRLDVVPRSPWVSVRQYNPGG